MSSNERGFTLIEVLAALVIVALGMMGVIQAVSQTVSNTSYLRDKTLAHWVAMNQMTEVRLENKAPDLDESSGEVDMAGQRWRWTMEVTQTPVESMRRIDVSVARADGPENSSLARVTGFYGTAIAPAGSVITNWSAAGDQLPGDDESGDSSTDEDDSQSESESEE